MPVTRQSPASKRAPAALRRLAKRYPDARIALRFSSPLECIVATVLSAQSTDETVNRVTEGLFQKYRSPEDYLRVPEEELQQDIHATGFFRQKTRSLRGLADVLLREFDGQVPSTIAELIKLPGVARKTANIVQKNCFPEAALKDPDSGIAVDTHVGRVAVRLVLTETDSKDAVNVEKDLLRFYKARDGLEVTNLFIEHGRKVCIAKKPLCDICVVEPLCPSSQVAGLLDRFKATRRSHAARWRVDPNPGG